MGDALFLVINLTDRDIIVTEWRKAYDKESKQWHRYVYGEKAVKSGDHRACSATEYDKRWRSRQKEVQMYPEWSVSLKSGDEEGIPLPIVDIKEMKAFVFKMEGKDKLVSSTVSRKAAESSGIKKGFFESLDKMESELISFVE